MVSTAISGIRPTGRLHLGNYIGSILPAQRHNANVLIAHYHAPEAEPAEILELHKALTKFFPAERIKMQSLHFNPELYFKLLSVTPTGLLGHMPQYKEKDKNALMFTYPVLMAQDIAEYDQVIVGTDQKPHIELAKDILHKVGYTCPTPIYEGGKVMDLRHPERKMSKSNPESCLFLDDTYGEIKSKIKRAVTTPEGRKNLDFIYEALGGTDVIEPNEALKMCITDLLVKHLGLVGEDD